MKDLSPPLHCPNTQCLKPIITLATADADAYVERGDIYICGDCAFISTFTRTGLQRMTQEQFDALAPEELADVTFAVRNILVQSQHQADQDQARILGLDGKPLRFS